MESQGRERGGGYSKHLLALVDPEGDAMTEKTSSTREGEHKAFRDLMGKPR